MTQAVPLEDRVAELERQMVEVRFMAGRNDKEVSDLQAVLNGHTGVLNAIREDHVDHSKKLARVEAEMHSGFAKVDENFAKVAQRFALLEQGQDKITRLLTNHLGDPDDEPPAGDAGE